MFEKFLSKPAEKLRVLAKIVLILAVVAALAQLVNGILNVDIKGVVDVIILLLVVAALLLGGWYVALCMYCWAVPMQCVEEKGLWKALLGNCGGKMQVLSKIAFTVACISGVAAAVLSFLMLPVGKEVNTILMILARIAAAVLGGAITVIIGWMSALLMKNWGDAACFWADAYKRNPIHDVSEAK